MQRDKLGRFASDGKPNDFNKKWVRRGKETKVATDADAIEKAYKAGFETARRLPITHNAKSCYAAYLEYGKSE